MHISNRFAYEMRGADRNANLHHASHKQIYWILEKYIARIFLIETKLSVGFFINRYLFMLLIARSWLDRLWLFAPGGHKMPGSVEIGGLHFSQGLLVERIVIFRGTTPVMEK